MPGCPLAGGGGGPPRPRGGRQNAAQATSTCVYEAVRLPGALSKGHLLRLRYRYPLQSREHFQVQALAGMYHGYWNRSLAWHGGEIPSEVFHEKSGRGCINAGLMRLDTLLTMQERNRIVDEMLAEVEQIDERDESYLREQYCLVSKIPGWRHIAVRWNCEVNPLQYVDMRGRGLRTAQEEMAGCG